MLSLSKLEEAPQTQNGPGVSPGAVRKTRACVPKDARHPT